MTIHDDDISAGMQCAWTDPRAPQADVRAAEVTVVERDDKGFVHSIRAREEKNGSERTFMRFSAVDPFVAGRYVLILGSHMPISRLYARTSATSASTVGIGDAAYRKG